MDNFRNDFFAKVIRLQSRTGWQFFECSHAVKTMNDAQIEEQIRACTDDKEWLSNQSNQSAEK